MKTCIIELFLTLIISSLFFACLNKAYVYDDNNISFDYSMTNNIYNQNHESLYFIESNIIINNDEKIINLYNYEPTNRNGLTIDQFKVQHPYSYYRNPKRVLPDFIEELFDETKIIKQTYDFSYAEINNNFAQILAGKSLDIIGIESSMIMYYINNDIILPLNALYSKTFINGDMYNNISKLYFGYTLYGLNIHIIPDYMFFYNKHLVDQLGLYDPLELWKNCNWTWDEWLNINITMQTEINTYQFETLGKANFTEYAFIASNGVDLFEINEKGYCVISIDDKYLVAQKFINEVNDVYKIKNIYNDKLYNFEDRAKKLREGLNFNYYEQPSSTFQFYHKDKKNWLDSFVADDIIGIVCAPRGPDLDISILSRDYGSNYYWAIPTYCTNPEAVMEYIHWVFTDYENYEERRKYYTDFNYNSDDELFAYGIEWIENSVNFNPLHAVTYPVEIMFHDMRIMELDNTNNVYNLQELIDEYINIFI